MLRLNKPHLLSSFNLSILYFFVNLFAFYVPIRFNERNVNYLIVERCLERRSSIHISVKDRAILNDQLIQLTRINDHAV